MDFSRYSRNCNCFTRPEVEGLFTKKVCVIGCGGLGGFVIEILSRFGIGELTIVDGDVFTVSNLNRQIFSDTVSLGINKAFKTKQDLNIINPHTKVTAVEEMLTEENGLEIIAGHDLVMDCLDSISARLILQMLCEQAGIPFVHAAISSFYGQVSFICPGDRTLDRIYKPGNEGTEKVSGNPGFTPGAVASVQAAQAIKFLTGKGHILRNEILFMDLLSDEYEIVAQL